YNSAGTDFYERSYCPRAVRIVEWHLHLKWSCTRHSGPAYEGRSDAPTKIGTAVAVDGMVVERSD
ncbi:MAG: hypothetical protein ACR2IV_22375, partial [Bryobacteraceae bacterium]